MIFFELDLFRTSTRKPPLDARDEITGAGNFEDHTLDPIDKLKRKRDKALQRVAWPVVNHYCASTRFQRAIQFSDCYLLFIGGHMINRVHADDAIEHVVAKRERGDVRLNKPAAVADAAAGASESPNRKVNTNALSVWVRESLVTFELNWSRSDVEEKFAAGIEQFSHALIRARTIRLSHGAQVIEQMRVHEHPTRAVLLPSDLIVKGLNNNLLWRHFVHDFARYLSGAVCRDLVARIE